MASHAEVKLRVNKVFELLVEGVSETKIIKELAEKEGWGVSERQMYNYIKKAQDLFEKEAKVHRSREFGKMLKQLDLLYRQTLKINDFKACRLILKDRKELLGM